MSDEANVPDEMRSRFDRLLREMKLEWREFLLGLEQENEVKRREMHAENQRRLTALEDMTRGVPEMQVKMNLLISENGDKGMVPDINRNVDSTNKIMARWGGIIAGIVMAFEFYRTFLRH